MTDPPPFGTAPAHIRALDFGHVLVLINYRTGKVQCLLPNAAKHWHDAAATGRLASLPPALSTQLLTAGLLRPSATPTPWPAPVPAKSAPASWGSAEHTAGTIHPAPSPGTITAAAALTAALTVKRLGPRSAALHRITTVLAKAASTCRRPATHDQAEAAVHAVRRASWYSPARTACLEESAATVLFLASRRLSVTWCHGVAPDPVRLHAWVQTDDGAPAAEPPSTHAYTPALTIGGHHQHRP
ncbi:lasso peptide biosynthesis B2 protein [Streptomyces sp. NPDC056149]|uniref:lasso peptide biosynthesis B2 protein n=1 Tax=Streptomyces sp. NPDC056149 TaxID=3345728 RepID=UPI0035E22DC0